MILNLLTNIISKCVAKTVSKGEKDQSIKIEVLKNWSQKLLHKNDGEDLHNKLDIEPYSTNSDMYSLKIHTKSLLKFTTW